MLGNVFSFHGRRGHLSYLLTGLLLTVIGFVIGFLDGLSGSSDGSGSAILLLIVTAGGIWTGLAIAAQRFHDFGASGWWSLFILIPFVGFMVGLVLLFAPGHKHANQYGPVPIPGGQAPALVPQ
jgi:uncharacterized membrane protein YhaH (DUF805 family)